MTATNHALTGAVIGVAITNPILALPLAVLSHLICDIIPHFGIRDKSWIKTSAFKRYLVSDAALCVILVIVLFVIGTPNWLLVSICAFLATSPDLLWIRKFRLQLKNKPYKPWPLETFLERIQTSETPKGAIVEAVWAVAMIGFLYQLI